MARSLYKNRKPLDADNPSILSEQLALLKGIYTLLAISLVLAVVGLLAGLASALSVMT